MSPPSLGSKRVNLSRKESMAVCNTSSYPVSPLCGSMITSTEEGDAPVETSTVPCKSCDVPVGESYRRVDAVGIICGGR